MFGATKLKDADKFTLEHFRRGTEPNQNTRCECAADLCLGRRSLNDVLVKHAIVTDGNKVCAASSSACGAAAWLLLSTTLGAHLCFPQDVLVETFRAMAELLTWGDQHEPAIFDYFVEKRVRRTPARA